MEGKLGNAYIKRFQASYSTIHRDISSSNANTICLQHAQHMTLENSLSQTANARNKVACAVLSRVTPDYVKTAGEWYSTPGGPGPKVIYVKGEATVRCTSFLPHAPELFSPREGLSCPNISIWSHLRCPLTSPEMTDALQKTCALLKWQVELKQGTLSGHQMPRFKLLIPALVSSITDSISAQLIFPLFPFSRSPFLPTPLVLLCEKHVPHPSVVPWEEADRLLLFMSALARIILGTGQESCLELLYS